ncbi:tetratricopeptide repeat protein [Candidatus Poribacteria bacterium]|nr:tetratricopeptide repeat protein [Candidatus Poribacteria bacterium]
MPQRSDAENMPLLGKRLRELREKRGWSRQELSDETKKGGAGTYVSIRQIQRVENDKERARVRSYHSLAKALGTTVEGLLKAAEPSWNVPYPRNPFFTGREDVLAQLRDALASGRAALTQTHAISGLGGIGKTQTAVEYAYRYREAYRAVLWVKADSQESLTSDFVAMAGLLNLPAHDPNLAVASVKRWLEGNDDWLLIFDNADEPQLVEAFLPRNPRGHILLTSRAHAFQHLGIAHPIRLEKLTPAEAKQFLLKRTGRSVIGLSCSGCEGEMGAFAPSPRPSPTTGGEGELHARIGQSTEVEAAEQLAVELDYLPLALEQAAAYIAQLDCSFQNYLTGFRKRGLALLEKMGAVIGQYPKSVGTTWALNFEQVERQSTASADLLRISAFLHPDQIPLELLMLGAAELSPALFAELSNVANNPLALDEVLAPLTQYSLITRDHESRTYSLHRLVQAVLKARLDEREQRQWAERAVKSVCAAFPHVDFPNWPLCERLLSHAQTCVAHIERWNFVCEDAARLLTRMGRYLHDRTRYDEAEPLLTRALAIREQSEGPNALHTAESLYNLGWLYISQIQYVEAEPLFQQALTIRQKTLDPNHPDIAHSLHLLGRLYHYQGKLAEAERLFKLSLEIPNHPDVAYNLIGLGTLSQAQGKFDEAEQFYQGALAILERALPPGHPSIVVSLNGLGKLYGIQGRFAEAERLLARALTIRENARGLDDSSIANSHDHLAHLYEAWGKFAEAEQHYQQMLAAAEKSLLPPESSYLIQGLQDYAALLEKMGRHAEAEKLETHAKAVQADHIKKVL